VDGISLRAERRIEEAPAAYKPIQPVIDAQVRAGAVRVVARLEPVLTFKARRGAGATQFRRMGETPRRILERIQANDLSQFCSSDGIA
jgi:hypothetical protein